MTQYDYFIAHNAKIPHVSVYKTDADGDVDEIVKEFAFSTANVILAISLADRLNKEN